MSDADRASWPELETAFHEALELPPSERAGFLATLAAGEPALARRLRDLLEAHGSLAEDFLEPATHASGALRDALPGEDLARRLVGRECDGFRIERLIASGGMGVVFEAIQAEPRRRVALKLLSGGAASPSAMRRFSFEAEVLARLQHPAIAQVFAAGTLEGVLPYFAMEYVEEARSITRWAREEGLDLPARLALFRRCCEAVAYGHRRGVIHRDLKPANLLVDREGALKVIDFGVARSTEAALGPADRHTRAGALVGTPAYMSPEQCAGGGADLDTRTDVYSLGVVLYELLGGRRAHDVTGMPLLEAARVVCEAEPPRLGRLDRSLAGDLETIVAKAMAKDREERYASPADLARDLGRWLAGEPVEARPPSLVYRARLFVRRNLLAVGAAAALLGVLAAGLVATGWGWSQARRARHEAEDQERRADREARVAQAVRDFLVEVIGAPSPWSSARAVPPEELKLVDALDRGLGRVDEAFAGEPEIEGSVRFAYGKLYASLGRSEEALEQFERAESLVGASDPEMTLRLRQNRGAMLGNLGRLEASEELLTQTLGAALALLGPDHERAIDCEMELALTQNRLGRFDQARERYESVHRRLVRLRGEDDPQALRVENNVARTLQEQGRFEEAEARFRAVFERDVARLGPDSPETLVALNNLALVAGQRGRLEEAGELFGACYRDCLRVMGERHPYTLQVAYNLGGNLVSRRRYEEAKALLEETLRLRREVLGPTHGDTIATLGSLSALEFERGNREEAAARAREIYALAEASLPDGHFERATHRLNLAGALVEVARLDEAEPLLESAIAELRAALPDAHPTVRRALEWRERLEEVRAILAGRAGE